MDELKWYENLTYNEAKDILQEKMENMKQNFIAAGYYLKYIRDNKLYLEDGYQTIWEFAEDNYGIKMSTASRWMSMNDKFSDCGNSPCLAEQYKVFGKSQLQEMLYLTDDQMEQAAPEMSAKEIRAIRKPEEKVCTVAEDEQCPVAKEEPVAPAQIEEMEETEIIDPEEAVIVTGLEDVEVEEDLYEEASDHSNMDLLKIELEKAQRLLKDLKKCYTDNDIRVRKQKLIVAALAGMLCDLENQENIPEPTQPPLPIMKNNDKRKEWLRNYKDWGLWYEDQNIDCRYYKYDFQDGSRLIVVEYPQRRKYWNHTELADEAYYHLLDKNRKWYGTNKTFEQQYMHSPDSETSLVEFLKILQKGEK